MYTRKFLKPEAVLRELRAAREQSPVSLPPGSRDRLGDEDYYKALDVIHTGDLLAEVEALEKALGKVGPWKVRTDVTSSLSDKTHPERRYRNESDAASAYADGSWSASPLNGARVQGREMVHRSSDEAFKAAPLHVKNRLDIAKACADRALVRGGEDLTVQSARLDVENPGEAARELFYYLQDRLAAPIVVAPHVAGPVVWLHNGLGTIVPTIWGDEPGEVLKRVLKSYKHDEDENARRSDVFRRYLGTVGDHVAFAIKADRSKGRYAYDGVEVEVDRNARAAETKAQIDGAILEHLKKAARSAACAGYSVDASIETNAAGPHLSVRTTGCLKQTFGPVRLDVGTVTMYVTTAEYVKNAISEAIEADKAARRNRNVERLLRAAHGVRGVDESEKVRSVQISHVRDDLPNGVARITFQIADNRNPCVVEIATFDVTHEQGPNSIEAAESGIRERIGRVRSAANKMEATKATVDSLDATLRAACQRAILADMGRTMWSGVDFAALEKHIILGWDPVSAVFSYPRTAPAIVRVPPKDYIKRIEAKFGTYVEHMTHSIDGAGNPTSTYEFDGLRVEKVQDLRCFELATKVRTYVFEYVKRTVLGRADLPTGVVVNFRQGHAEALPNIFVRDGGVIYLDYNVYGMHIAEVGGVTTRQIVLDVVTAALVKINDDRRKKAEAEQKWTDALKTFADGARTQFRLAVRDGRIDSFSVTTAGSFVRLHALRATPHSAVERGETYTELARFAKDTTAQGALCAESLIRDIVEKRKALINADGRIQKTAPL